MKLFVIAALVAVAAAGRLEHLERSYLPPDSNSIGVARSSFGSNGAFGSHGSHGSFGANSGGFGANSGAFGAAGSGLHGQNAGARFGGATSNQYLPPDHGPSGSNGGSQFGGSLHGFGGQNLRSQQYGGHQGAQQYSAPSSQYSAAGSQYSAPSTQYSARTQSQYSPQSAATSRQYLAPHSGSYQQPPQQAFDEQTGYHY